MTATFCTQP